MMMMMMICLLDASRPRRGPLEVVEEGETILSVSNNLQCFDRFTDDGDDR